VQVELPATCSAEMDGFDGAASMSAAGSISSSPHFRCAWGRPARPRALEWRRRRTLLVALPFLTQLAHPPGCGVVLNPTASAPAARCASANLPRQQLVVKDRHALERPMAIELRCVDVSWT
jgi:hypothetical protein